MEYLLLAAIYLLFTTLALLLAVFLLRWAFQTNTIVKILREIRDNTKQ